MKNISCPPASKIASAFRLDDKTAKAVRDRIKAGYSNESFDLPRSSHWSHAASLFMEDLNKLAEFHGVESLYRQRDEIYYLNAGDSYAATLIFNAFTGTVRIGCIGDIIERLPRSKSDY